MAITQYYVDPAIAADSGTGTIGDPFGDVQYALNNITRNATNGDRINIKAGTDEVLAASLTLATYGTPSSAAPLVIQGYTSAADDGGIGGISGAGTYGIFAAANAYTHLIDMHLHNTGAADVLAMGINCIIFRCEIDNTTAAGADLGNTSIIANCYIHNCANGVEAGSRGCTIYGNFFANGTGDFANAIVAVDGSAIINNVFKLDGNSRAIYVSNNTAAIIGNTIWGDAVATAGGNTGTAIVTASNGAVLMFDSIIEGFSGTGGAAIDNQSLPIISLNNALYNNTTNENNTDDNIITANNTLSASPFVNAATGDFDINGTVTDVTEAALPQTWPGLTTSTTPKPDVGAVQAGAGAGGASIYRRVARILGG